MPTPKKLPPAHVKYDPKVHPKMVYDYIALCRAENRMPNMGGLSMHSYDVNPAKRVTRSSIQEHMGRYKEFAEAMEMFAAAQEDYNWGATGENVQPTALRIFALKNSGYTDRIDTKETKTVDVEVNEGNISITFTQAVEQTLEDVLSDIDL